jgi:hypothetical protein
MNTFYREIVEGKEAARRVSAFLQGRLRVDKRNRDFMTILLDYRLSILQKSSAYGTVYR